MRALARAVISKVALENVRFIRYRSPSFLEVKGNPGARIHQRTRQGTPVPRGNLCFDRASLQYTIRCYPSKLTNYDFVPHETSGRPLTRSARCRFCTSDSSGCATSRDVGFPEVLLTPGGTTRSQLDRAGGWSNRPDPFRWHSDSALPGIPITST